MPEREVHDVVIIGGGPAGLMAAVYSARAKLKTIVLDKNATAGALGKAGKIESFPGLLEAKSGMDLLAAMRAQAQKFGAAYQQIEVIGVDLTKDTKEVMTLGEDYRSRVVIVATGSMGRKPTLEGEAAFTGKGVAYCAACDAAFFEGKDIAACGDFALLAEDLDQLARFARKLYVATGSPDLTEQQKSTVAKYSNVELLPGYRVARITGRESVEGIELAGPQDRKVKLDVTGVFLYLYGRLPVVDFLHGSLKLTDEQECVKTDREDMSTSVPGVYAVGDVTCRRLRQAVLAAADGCTAAMSAERYLTGRSGY
ncbi:MAG: FAD-dependent oxidoreductase [Dehalococcoidia bacterium]|nr:FAD-dependent oxidoreductase [Dehalococcoidia bacterium]